MNKISPMKAISNHCRGCIYDPLDKGTCREQIENCKITQCELYDFRPRSKLARDIIRQDYLAMLTPEKRAAELLKSRDKSDRMRALRLKKQVELQAK
jgi:hypothetical protein